MVKILFVCHGNICRSPMAEFIMKDLAAKYGLADMLEIKSAATSSEEIGNGVYPPARKVLAKHNILCGGKTAVRMTEADYEYYDLIVVMDKNNLRNIRRAAGDDPKGKISMLMDYTDRPGEVADPWYTGDFERTYKDIYEGCLGLLEVLKNEKM